MKNLPKLEDSGVQSSNARRLCWLILLCQTLPATNAIRQQKEPQFIELLAQSREERPERW